jgi:hypothetical protein
VAAVFGRGRAVEVFPATEISRELITDVSQFLCGACSCQVKQLNPGFDLLAATHWEKRLFDPESPPPVLAPREEADAEPVMVPIPTGPPSDEVEAMANAGRDSGATSAASLPSRPWITWSIAAIAVAAVLLAVSRFSRT